jgi:hypothetical protein
LNPALAATLIKAQRREGIMGHGQEAEEHRCERCERLVVTTYLSTIHEEAICEVCLKEEQAQLARLKLGGVAPTKVAGAGGTGDDEFGEANEGR